MSVSKAIRMLIECPHSKIRVLIKPCVRPAYKVVRPMYTSETPTKPSYEYAKRTTWYGPHTRFTSCMLSVPYGTP